jgi:hypothetical protein
MSDLYEDDIVLWAERQAALLRRRASGELVNDAELDWPNIAEEIDSVGSEQRHAVQSLLRQAIVHILKAIARPQSRDAPTWRADAVGFRTDAASRYVPSMRQRINLDMVYRQALRALPEAVDGIPPLPVPDACPFTLDELLSETWQL